jgi:ribosomal-protein-alanine N-acetyltransferase
MSVSDVAAAHGLLVSGLGADAVSRESLVEEVSSSSRVYLVAESGTGDDASLVGVAGMRLTDVGEVLSLAVAGAARRGGVATALVQALLREAGRRGRSQLWLEVSEGNAAAKGLYRSLGFVPVTRRSRYYADGSAALVLRRSAQRMGEPAPSERAVPGSRDVPVASQRVEVADG